MLGQLLRCTIASLVFLTAASSAVARPNPVDVQATLIDRDEARMVAEARELFYRRQPTADKATLASQLDASAMLPRVRKMIALAEADLKWPRLSTEDRANAEGFLQLAKAFRNAKSLVYSEWLRLQLGFSGLYSEDKFALFIQQFPKNLLFSSWNDLPVLRIVNTSVSELIELPIARGSREFLFDNAVRPVKKKDYVEHDLTIHGNDRLNISWLGSPSKTQSSSRNLQTLSELTAVDYLLAHYLKQLEHALESNKKLNQFEKLVAKRYLLARVQDVIPNHGILFFDSSNFPPRSIVMKQMNRPNDFTEFQNFKGQGVERNIMVANAHLEIFFDDFNFQFFKKYRRQVAQLPPSRLTQTIQERLEGLHEKRAKRIEAERKIKNDIETALRLYMTEPSQSLREQILTYFRSTLVTSNSIGLLNQAIVVQPHPDLTLLALNIAQRHPEFASSEINVTSILVEGGYPLPSDAQMSLAQIARESEEARPAILNVFRTLLDSKMSVHAESFARALQTAPDTTEARELVRAAIFQSRRDLISDFRKEANQLAYTIGVDDSYIRARRLSWVIDQDSDLSEIETVEKLEKQNYLYANAVDPLWFPLEQSLAGNSNLNALARKAIRLAESAPRTTYDADRPIPPNSETYQIGRIIDLATNGSSVAHQWVISHGITNPHPEVRSVSIRGLDPIQDSALIVRIAKTDLDTKVQKEIIHKLVELDPKLLNEAAIQDFSPAFRNSLLEEVFAEKPRLSPTAQMRWLPFLFDQWKTLPSERFSHLNAVIDTFIRNYHLIGPELTHAFAQLYIRLGTEASPVLDQIHRYLEIAPEEQRLLFVKDVRKLMPRWRETPAIAGAIESLSEPSYGPAKSNLSKRLERAVDRTRTFFREMRVAR